MIVVPKKYNSVLCVWLSLACVTASWGQSVDTEVISTQDGLSQGYISDIIQDRDGFLWMGTKNGLNRFDGRSFTVFHADVYDPFALRHEFVTALWEYRDFLLVGTNGGGLHIFHRPTQRFYHVPGTPPGILDVQVDRVGNIWLLSWKTYVNGELYHLRLAEGFWDSLQGEPIDAQMLEIEKQDLGLIPDMLLNRSGSHLYYARDSFLVRMDVSTGEKIRSFHPLIKRFASIFLDRKEAIWLASGDNILHQAKQGWTVYPAKRSMNQILGQTATGSLLLSDNANYVYLLDPKQQGGNIAHTSAEWYLANTVASSAFIDTAQNVWIGTNGYGLLKISPQQNKFKTYFRGKSVYSAPFYTQDSIVGYFPNVAKQLRLVYTGSDPSLREADHAIADLARNIPPPIYRARYGQDRAGNHWLLHFFDKTINQYGLYFLPKGATRYQVYPLPHIASQLGQLVIDAEGYPWIGLNGYLYRFDPETETFRTFDYRSSLSFNHEVRSIIARPAGGWWLGTSLGLLEAIPQNGDFAFRLYQNDPKDATSLLNNDIASLYLDEQRTHTLWIGTKGGGLNRKHTESDHFDHITLQQGLPDNTVYGILPDTSGHLWLSTNKGLVRYHPQRGSIKQFTAADGLQADEFNTWAYAQCWDGRLMFGGVNGLNIFYPTDFVDNAVLPQVHITGLRVNREDVRAGDSTAILQRVPEYSRSVRLSYRQNNITFEFASLEYTSPSKNRFRYYLEGAEPAWSHEGSENTAAYLNLAPGTYTFRVMGSNNDGVWNPEPASLQLTIIPPWYRSLWAYMAYGLIILGLIGGMVWVRLRQLRLQQRLALEQQEAKRVRELDQFKTHLYTNLTHEFRTPITLIKGATEQLAKAKAEPKKNWLATIRRNSDQLLTLINQLLDLSKIENRLMQIDWVHDDVVRYLQYLVEGFQPRADHQGIELLFESSVPSYQMDYDAEKWRQIVSNILTNALKHTPSGGSVRLQMSVASAADHAYCILRFIDTGNGIAPADLPHIFDRFYQVTSSARAGGTGIGLALCRELVQLLGGQIAVESILGQGTTFTLRLPVHHAAKLAQVSLVSNQPPLFSPTATSSASSAPGLARLLIVEDNAEITAYLQHCLQAHFSIQVAVDGQQGIEQALAEVPDLILSDIMMPRKDGLELCDTLKNDARTSHIPIVLLTARADIESRIAGLRRGADAYLAKPFHEEELIVTLQKLLDNRRRLQARYSRVSLAEVASDEVVETATAAEVAVEDAFLQEVRQQIEAVMDDPDLSASLIGRQLGMSRSNVYAKLTALTGMSFGTYVRKLRLQHAEQLLIQEDLNISEVAYAIGFSDPKYFSRVFREQYGVSPSQYKATRG